MTTIPAWLKTDLARLPVLSIRQPWANAILNGLKDVENRSWRTLAVRGRILLHASSNVQTDDLRNWNQFLKDRGMNADEMNAKVREGGIKYGGIIGSVEILDCIKDSPSKWYTGQWAYILANPEPLEFVHVRGLPGFFRLSNDLITSAAV